MLPLRIVARFQREDFNVQAAAPDLSRTLKEVVQVLENLKPWLGQFGAVLRQAEKGDGLPDGWVWQPVFVKYFEDGDFFEAQLRDLDDQLLGVYASQEGVSGIANAARGELRQPKKARLGYAVSNLQFFDHPKLGKDYIAYDVGTLKEWAQAYGKWLADAIRGIQAQMKKAQKKSKSDP